MGAFAAIVVMVSLPIIVKAVGFALFTFGCDAAVPQYQMRFTLPPIALALGYLIFLLEGVQSSVILGNKQSAESLDGALATVEDASPRKRFRAKAALESSLDHKPIDDFIVGRQLLIIASAFFFKFAYDTASLRAGELKMLHDLSAACPITTELTADTYRILDHWLFSALLCSVLVAYVFQVPAKLMAQNYPMRFLTLIWGAYHIPGLSRLVGNASLLVWPLVALRRRGEDRHKRKLFSFFASKEELPIDSRQALGALVSHLGESVEDICFDLRLTTYDGEPHWFVHVVAMHRVFRPGQVFGHVFHGAEITDFRCNSVLAFETPGAAQKPDDVLMSKRSVRNEEGRQIEEQLQLSARFDNTISSDAFVEWDVTFLVPVMHMPDATERFAVRVFDVAITKPVRSVRFYVEATASSQIQVNALPLEGVQTPKHGEITRGRADGWQHAKVDYPSINSRLRFRF